MANAALMDVFNSRNQFEIELAGLLFGESSVPDDIVKQLTTVCVLHDHIELLLCLNNFIELYNVGVAHLLKNLDLPGNSFDVLLVMNFIFLENFDSHLFSSESMLPQLNLSKCTFSQVFA